MSITTRRRRQRVVKRRWNRLAVIGTAGVLLAASVGLSNLRGGQAVVGRALSPDPISAAMRHSRPALTVAGGIWVLAGSLDRPRTVLVVAHTTILGDQLWQVGLRWANGQPEVTRTQDLTAAGVTINQVVVRHADVMTLEAYGNQIQAVRVWNTVSGDHATFGFAVPVAAAAITAPSTIPGVMRVRFQEQNDSSWHIATVVIGDRTSTSRSPWLVSATPASNHHSLFIRVVEETRQILGSGVVAALENAWYGTVDWVHQTLWSLGLEKVPPISLVHLPPPAQSSLPLITMKELRRRIVPLPPNLSIPPSWPHPAGAGVWQPVGPLVGGMPSMEETYLAPDPARPYAVVALVWINTAALHLHLVAGTTEPVSVSGIHGPGEIPPSVSVRERVAAAFNSGFKSNSGPFGEVVDGVTYSPPVPGLATVAIYANHQVKLGTWGQSIVPDSQLVSLRQNLPLLVRHGVLNPHIGQQAYWGLTVNNAIRVWRSGLGILPDGNLIYAAGSPLSARRLALALQTAGVVNAMELDINSYWVTFNFYSWTGQGLVGTKLLSGMTRSADRYLTPGTRDFFYLTVPAGSTGQ